MCDKANEEHFLLLAVDSEEDSFFMERALRQSRRIRVIGSVRNGVEAVAYLSGEGSYTDRQLWPFPHVLFMGLKMAQPDADRVLEWLRQHPSPGLKVAVLADHDLQRQIEAVKALGPEAFQPHTLANAKLLELVERLEKLLLSPGPENAV